MFINVSLLNEKSELVTKCCHENKFHTTNQKQINTITFFLKSLKLKNQSIDHLVHVA